MHLSNALVLAALAAAVVAVVFSGNRLVPILALVASGLEAVLRFGLVTLSVRGIAVGLVLAVALAVTGVVLWTRAARKIVITAATVLAFVGIVQTLTALGS